MLERAVRRFERYLCRWGPDIPGDPEDNLVASAVSGCVPPAGPQWSRGLAPLGAEQIAYD